MLSRFLLQLLISLVVRRTKFAFDSVPDEIVLKKVDGVWYISRDPLS